jgi:hypothetical protein
MSDLVEGQDFPTPSEFVDFLTDSEVDEILAIEEEFGVDISLDDIFTEIDDNDDDSDWAE